MRACVVLLSLSLLAACSSKSRSAPPPTVTAVLPQDGTSLGGTNITLMGTQFKATTTVMVGGNAATNVIAVTPDTLTCDTPAGNPGTTVDIEVANGTQTATLAAAFTYHPTPSVTGVLPDRGTASGGTDITITGTGFQDNAPGANTVTVGGVAATGVLVVDDMTITCTTAAGTGGAAGVVVSNANGQDTLPGAFTFVTPILYAADGRAAASGNLYTVDITTGNATVVGAIGFPVTGLAFDESGVLYGAVPAGGGTQQDLITIDTTTGAGTVVAQLRDAGGTENGVTDITFLGARLFGWGRPRDPLNQRLLEIDPLTAIVTDLGGSMIGGGGNALEADPAGTLWLIFTGGSIRTIHTLDPDTGVSTASGTVTPNGGVINSMAYLEGVLYVVDSSNDPGTTNELAMLDPVTGVLTNIGPLPTSVDGLAGTVK